MRIQSLITIIISLSIPSVALAGSANIHSTVQEDFKVDFELATGEPKQEIVSKGASSTGTNDIYIKDGGSTKVTITTAANEAVATGTVLDNRNYLLLPAGKGYTLISAGSLSSPATSYPGVIIVNSLPENYTVDLFGNNGASSAKNVKVGKTFEAKNATVIKGADTAFNVFVTGPDGAKVKAASQVNLGGCYVLHKTYDDKLTMSYLGYVDDHILKPGAVKAPAKTR